MWHILMPFFEHLSDYERKYAALLKENIQQCKPQKISSTFLECGEWISAGFSVILRVFFFSLV